MTGWLCGRGVENHHRLVGSMGLCRELREEGHVWEGLQSVLDKAGHSEGNIQQLEIRSLEPEI